MERLSKKPSILAVCGDPGGARALLPVLQQLKHDDRIVLTCAAYRQGWSILAAAGFEVVALNEDRSDAQAAMQLLVTTKASLLLAATSVNGADWEKVFIASARAQGIASVGVLDFWSNYLPRFSSTGGQLDCLPDRLAVMDARAVTELTAIGVPTASLVVTGQPAFDALETERSAFTPAVRARTRAHLGLQAGEKLVLFVSQPFRQLTGTGLASLGFDEQSVWTAVLQCLPNLGRTARVTLAIRPHPRESLEWFQPASGPGWRTVLARESEAHELVLSADLVVGMNSVLLLEASGLGCVVVSLQPDLRGPDPLPTNASGASHAVFESAAIPSTLARMLFDESARQTLLARAAGLRPAATATRQVVELLYSMLPANTA